MTRDAIWTTIVAGGRARIQLNIEVNINKLISTLSLVQSLHVRLQWVKKGQAISTGLSSGIGSRGCVKMENLF